MSLIFDALQRAEAERSGVGLSTLSAATEVLRLAELRAARELKPAIQVPIDVQAEARVTGPSVRDPRQAAATIESAEAITAEQADTCERFRSLQISICPESHLVCLQDWESPAAEQFGFLGVRLQQLKRERLLKRLLITSTIAQEGKSMVAANLACALARRTQQRILLVEGDVRRPSLTKVFGLGSKSGLCELLQSERSLTESIYHLDGAGLWILPAGSTTKDPLELLHSGRLPIFIDELDKCFDWIVIDSPPVLPVADTSIWMRVADGILLVSRQGTTEKRQLRKGLETIDRAKLLGALVNCRQRRFDAESSYSYRRTRNPTSKST
jgi:capsular exopolysaccharide synthesis family protein